MKRNKHIVLLVLGVVLLLTTSFVACSQPPVATESPPQSPPETEGPVEIEEPEEHPIYISSLAYELKHQILLGDLEDFLKKYPIELFKLEEEEEKVWIHELSFWAAGSWLLVSRIPAGNVYQAKIHIENADSLLTRGKLPTEVEPRPLDKNEVAKELEEAKSLLMAQWSSSSTWEEEDIEWVKQSGDPDFDNERTIGEVIETYDDYHQRLSKIVSTLGRILSELPKAVEE